MSEDPEAQVERVAKAINTAGHESLSPRCLTNELFELQKPRALLLSGLRRFEGIVVRTSRTDPNLLVVKWDHVTNEQAIHRSLVSILPPDGWAVRAD